MGLFKPAKPKTANTRTRTVSGNTSYNRKGGALTSVTKSVRANGYRVTTNIATGKTRKTKI
jgi:hypothetical protein